MLSEPREARIDRSTFVVINTRPKSIDLTTRYVGKQDIVETKSIYAVHGDRLIYCVAPPGQPRPEEFFTRNGDGLTLVTLRRVRAESGDAPGQFTASRQ